MVRRKSSRGRNKIQPAVQTIFIPPTPFTNVPATGAKTSFYCDLSQITSLLNRRFMRQGLNWAVAGIKIQSTMNIGSIECLKLPNTWVMSNAWEKSFRTWSKMNNEAMAETQSARPKFLDFKIFADEEHHQAGFAANLLPSAGEPSAFSLYKAGEWESSKLEIPDATNAFPALTQTYELVATGRSFSGPGASGFNCVSLIDGYAASRALPNILDPNMPGDADDTTGSTPENWISAVFNQGTEQSSEVIEDLTTENNIAPYPFENDGVHTDTMYPGGANQGPGLQLHDSAYWTNTAQTVLNTHRIKGGNFPCGLIKFNCVNYGEQDASLHIQIDLMPGDHRGYLCEPMTEM